MISMLFRMPFWVYLLLAPVALVLGISAYFGAEHDDAVRQKALSHGPPPPVTIERYDPSKNKSDYNEVVIEGQLDVDKIVDVTKTKGSRTVGTGTVAPLYPTGAKDRSGGIKAIFVSDGILSDQAIKAMIVRDGTFGPVIRIVGIDTTASGTPEYLRTAQEKIGTIPANAVFLNPFDGDRKKELAPRREGTGFLIFGAIVGLLLAGYGLYRKPSAAPDPLAG